MWPNHSVENVLSGSRDTRTYVPAGTYLKVRGDSSGALSVRYRLELLPPAQQTTEQQTSKCFHWRGRGFLCIDKKNTGFLLQTWAQAPLFYLTREKRQMLCRMQSTAHVFCGGGKFICLFPKEGKK